ncbi:MAG: TIGR00366 family protein [candidate division WOR-3 bacterium]
MKKFFKYYFLFFEKFYPDPFIFVLILTIITILLGSFLTENSIIDMVYYWGNSFWDLLSFSMQMVLILVTGGALAESPPLKRIIKKISSLNLSQEFFIVFTSIFSMILAFFNWGLSLIASALLVKEIGKSFKEKNKYINYPLLCASAYTGLLVWHGGLSGSAPLTCATKGHFLESKIGVINISETIFSIKNILLWFLFVIFLPLFIFLLSKIKISKIKIECEIPELEEKEEEKKPFSFFLNILENSFIFPALFFLIFLINIFYIIKKGEFSLNLNTLNFIFLFAGLFLHFSPHSYLKATFNSVKASTGIIIQFPFYAGIMGMMKYSGLINVFSRFFVSFSVPENFPFYTFISAGIVNLFIPSGGGQWAVQGPVMIEAAKILGVPFSKVIMAIAYGDEWTNMVQPFWALPILGITRVKVQELVPYTLFFLIISFIFFTLILFN